MIPSERELGPNTVVMLLGSGELGKEVAIEAARLGLTVVAVDRYPGAPAMQVATRSHVVDMLDPDELLRVIELEQPTIIVPEIEAIAVDCLAQVESWCQVVPTARGVQLTMNREGIRCLAAEELNVATSGYHFAETQAEVLSAGDDLGFPCVVKPIMSSSGKGQSVAHDRDGLIAAFEYARETGRTHTTRVIVESFIDFDYEITLLTVRAANGTHFCEPIGHFQVDGDYRQSWQPHPMSEAALRAAKGIAKLVTDDIGGYGIFGVEFLVKGDDVYFSEVSPRPHDTGLVTLASQDLSEFALHVRAILGLPVEQPLVRQPSASATINAIRESDDVSFDIAEALQEPNVQIRLFGKPSAHKNRRIGVVVATADSVEEARDVVTRAVEKVRVRYA